MPLHSCLDSCAAGGTASVAFALAAAAAYVLHSGRADVPHRLLLAAFVVSVADGDDDDGTTRRDAPRLASFGHNLKAQD